MGYVMVWPYTLGWFPLESAARPVLGLRQNDSGMYAVLPATNRLD